VPVPLANDYQQPRFAIQREQLSEVSVNSEKSFNSAEKIKERLDQQIVTEFKNEKVDLIDEAPNTKEEREKYKFNCP
jgi:hypothetical protein